jgi:hypothetical protein
MKITRNAQLELSSRDLRSDAKEPEWNSDRSIDINLFSSDVQVAIWYARCVRTKITYKSTHGVFTVVGEGLYGYPTNLVKTWENVKKKRRKRR